MNTVSYFTNLLLKYLLSFSSLLQAFTVYTGISTALTVKGKKKKNGSVCQALQLKCEQNKKFAALVRTVDPYHVACVYIWLA